MRTRTRYFPIRLTISSVFVLILSTTVLSIVAYSYWSSVRSMRSVSGDLLEQHTSLAVEKTVDYLDPASEVTGLCTRLYNDGVIDIDDNERFNKLCVEILRKYPQFVLVNYGTERGNNYGVERTDHGGAIVFQTIRETPETKACTYAKTFVDAAGKVLKVEEEILTYDPRVRPWYRGAIEVDGRFWGGAYVLVTDRKQIAISISYPVKDAQGRVLGVFGGDLAIREISRFLEGIKVGIHGIVLLLNENDEVLAHPDPLEAITGSGYEQRLKHVNELAMPWLVAALKQYEVNGDRQVVVDHEGARQVVAIRPFPEEFGRDWKVLLTVPEDDFVGAIKETNRVSLALSLAVLVLSTLLLTFIAGRISRPIVSLTTEANRIRNLDLEGDIRGRSAIKEINQIYAAMRRMKTGMRAFLKYVPATLVKQLVDSGVEVQLGGRHQELTVFFSDIKGFTSVSEHMDPQALMTHLSRYLDELTRVVMDEQGTIDKYIGDSIMAFWGAPLPCEDHAYQACRAAVRCQQALVRLNGEWLLAGLPQLPTRVGLHTGEGIVGNVGSSDRMNYTVLGDVVNLTSRLESANRVYGTSVILSGATHERVADRVLARPLDLVVVKGRTQPTPILELVALLEDDPSAALRDQVARYSRAFEHYLSGAWDQALALLTPLHAELGQDDPPVARLLERCQGLVDAPPADDSWRCTQLLSK